MCCYCVGKRQNHRSVGERWPGGRKKVSDSVPIFFCFLLFDALCLKEKLFGIMPLIRLNHNTLDEFLIWNLDQSQCILFLVLRY
jgi:hypothetical protein